jgi:hypothetical protein
MQAFARTLRTLLLLTLFLTGAGVHDLAMAQEAMPGAAATVQMHQPVAHLTCTGHHCGDTGGSPCCVMGQCMLGVACAAEFAFPPRTADIPVPSAAMITAWLLQALPFRPPAVV